MDNLLAVLVALPYGVLLPLSIYLVKHEKRHSRMVIYLRSICKKLDIPCDEKD